jgi:hypothetical protein
MLHNQSSRKKERQDHGPLAEWVNWTKWSRNKNGSGENIPTHVRIKLHMGAKTGQKRNKCCAVSTPHQPVTQNTKSWAKMFPLIKLSLVSKLLRNNRKANIKACKKTCFCQINYVVVSGLYTSLYVSRLYAQRTVYPPPGYFCKLTSFYSQFFYSHFV